jgi:hypothetical protein
MSKKLESREPVDDPIKLELDESTKIALLIASAVRGETDSEQSAKRFRELARRRANLLVKRTLSEAS